jgi:hypothetical protein
MVVKKFEFRRKKSKKVGFWLPIKLKPNTPLINVFLLERYPYVTVSFSQQDKTDALRLNTGTSTSTWSVLTVTFDYYCTGGSCALI